MSTKVALMPAQTGWLGKMFGRKTRLPRVGDGRRVFAVGDIHGRNDLLEDLLDQIRDYAAANPGRQNVLVFLGDYIDRGPDSKAVVDRLISLGRNGMAGWQTVFLRGNHEQSLLNFLEDPMVYQQWRDFGGPATLLSYGVRPPRFDDEDAFFAARDELLARCPASHIEFYNSLVYMHEECDFVFVHAGIRPGVALNRQTERDMLWIRDEFLMSDMLSDKIVVHGHTPAEMPVQKPNRLGLDTCAHATGRLTAVILEEDRGMFLSTTKIPEQAIA